MKKIFTVYLIIPALLVILIFTFSGYINSFFRIADITAVIDNKYTNVGNIGLNITNRGIIGSGFSNWQNNQPSCEYPLNSRIEHLFAGGIWIGGIKNGIVHVTTGTVDNSNWNYILDSCEFATDTVLMEKSALYNPTLPRISDQDFISRYYDTSKTGVNPNHNPLGIKVLFESYAFNLNFANAFVILNYKVVNIGYGGDTTFTIDSVYAGMWTDCVVRNTNVTPPGTGGTLFYNKSADGYDDSLRIGYKYDYNGDPGLTDSYIGIQLLGVSPKPANEKTNVRTHYTIWKYKNDTDPLYFMPRTDIARLEKMRGFLSTGIVIDTSKLNYLRHTPDNRSNLVSYGPYRRTDGTPFALRYRIDTLNIVFAVVCAKKWGTDPTTWDSAYQRTNLNTNAGWAQRAYDNNYKLPTPPAVPELRTEIESQKVTLWWTNNAENSVDSITYKKDFEGYRIYRTNAGADLTLSQDLMSMLKLIADFDSAHNNYSNNTGFGFIKLNTPKTFAGDSRQYWYKFEFPAQLNGFQYVYTVTAYDKGDTSLNLESLESSLLANAKRIVVGTPANDNEDAEIGVYPNPYYGSAYWDNQNVTGSNFERTRKIYFFNLPSKCEISIWTLAGDLVDKFTHDAGTYNGNDIEWFKTFADGSQVFAGGEHAWDLITKNDQAIATGLYLFTVKDLKTGKIKKGKFLIVK